MDKGTKELLETLEGSEVWTNAFGKRFGERVCVGIEYPFCWHEGKKFKPNRIEWKEVIHDQTVQEYGTDNWKEIMKMEGFG
jgi:hypothetical protein